MRYAKKIDASEKAIVSVLKAIGCLVWRTKSDIDLVVCDPQSDITALWDCKTKREDGGKDTLTDTQRDMLRDGWIIYFPHSPEDAVDIVNLWRKR